MSPQATEQFVHDQVNLGRFVKRLEKSVSDEDWSEDPRKHAKWLKAQGVLQKIKHARKLLEDVEAHDSNPTPKSAQRYEDVRLSLDRMDEYVLALSKRIAPERVRRAPLLPQIPLPSPDKLSSERTSTSPLSAGHLPPEATLIPGDEPQPTLPAEDLPLSPSEASPSHSNRIASSIPATALLPPSQSATASKSTATPDFLQNSNALQQELSDQLAQMAVQLRRNAIHFSDSLANDRAVVGDAQEKLEGNHDVMKKERVRLRDHRGKSGSTTCLTLAIMLVVAVAFVLMFFVIRLT